MWRQKKHEILEEHVIELNTPEDSFRQGYFICECRGCGEVSFVDEYIDYQENYYDREIDDVVMNPRRKFHPSRMARKEPKWVSRLEAEVSDVLREAYNALHNDSPMLAAMGVRAALEIAMISLVGDNGTFSKNVDKMIAEGHIAHRLKDTIVSTLDVGSAAIHRGYRPDPGVLNDVFEVIEGILISTLLPHYGARISKKTPPRPPKGTGKP